MNNFFSFQSIIGDISIVENSNNIISINFGRIEPSYSTQNKITPILLEAANEVKAFLKGELKVFSIPYKVYGTCFQEKVWSSLTTIPYGETLTYKDIAALISQPKAYRAVGNANNKNPLPIIIPCHRVIGTNKKLTGYAGGLKIKEYLLNLEAKNS